MTSINWDKEFKCRASATVKLLAVSRSNPQLTEIQAKRLSELEGKETLTENQKKEVADLNVKKANGSKVILSDGCIEYLMECYSWITEGTIPVGKESLDLLQMRKGKECEAEAKNLLNIVDGEQYKIHKDRISNDFLSGEIDYYLGDSIYEATNVTDCKNAFDHPTFLKKTRKGIENGHTEQLQSYGDITGAPDLFVANCLISFTPEMITDMEYKIMRKLNCTTTESPEFLAEWPKWLHSMNFDQIPETKRVFKRKVEPFTETEKQIVYDRVKVCREYLANFHEEYEKLNNS